MLTRTVGAKNKTKLAEAQEIANLEYTARLIDRHINEESETGVISDIVSALQNNGFTVDYETTSTESITGVRLLDGATAVSSVSLETVGDNTEKILTIDTIMGGAAGTRTYYVQIDNMWHKIEELANNKGIEIKKDGKASLDKSNSNNGDQTINIAITGLDDSTTVKKAVENQGNTTYEDITANTTFVKGDKIKITAGTSNLSNVTITVSVTNVTENYNVALTVTKPLAPTATTATPDTTNFSTAYGTIDVIWLDGKTNTPTKIPNDPTSKLSGMTKVTWTEKTDTTTNEKYWDEDATAQSTWYNYSESKWANAKNSEDGSYFVWIPRYAYRITYYEGDWSELATTDANYETYKTVTGYYDGYGMWKDADGSMKYKLEDGIETVKYNGKSYIVHPAFMKDTGKKAADGETDLPDYDRGGWSDNLTGIWVAKYEMSRENYNSTTGKWEANGTTNNGGGNVEITNANKDTVRAVSKPCTETSTVSSWRNINIGNCYKNSYNYERDLESHLMKNSEWGALAYLTHSQYGTNGKKIAINNSSDWLTGNSGGTANSTYQSGISNYYYSTNGVKASSTGNVYGIYDLSGGAQEYVAAYNKSGDLNYVGGVDYGKKMTDNAKDTQNKYISTEYITAYDNNSKTSNGKTITYTVGKTGDSTKEVYINSAKNWFSANSNFANINTPFLYRGGFWNCTYTCAFFLEHNSGLAETVTSFRIVLAP